MDVVVDLVAQLRKLGSDCFVFSGRREVVFHDGGRRVLWNRNSAGCQRGSLSCLRHGGLMSRIIGVAIDWSTASASVFRNDEEEEQQRCE